MAASSKPGFVHFTLIFFVMLSIILGVVTYITYRDLDDSKSKLTKAQADVKKVQTLARTQDEQIIAMKSLIGAEFENVGLDAPDDPTTVIGGAKQRMVAAVGPLPTPDMDLLEALEKMRTDINNLSAENAALTANVEQMKVERDRLNQQHSSNLGVEKTARSDAETDLQKRITQSEEDIRTKDRKIADLERNYSQTLIDLEQLREQMQQQVKEKDDYIASLTIINDTLREKLQEIEQVSFERADGEIRWVDHSSKLVWINVGSADQVQKRTTFSVYTKANAGIGRGGDEGRGAEDIKGAIEVTRIIGAHLSEARVLDENLYEPISAGDPIYTPLWSPGRTESFSFVGLIDLDSDGKSDRQTLHEIVATTGADIDNEVDDNGNLIGQGLSVNTKFLVIGEIPDPTSTSKLEEQEKLQKISEKRLELVKEARTQGVRIISLNDFLSYIGYKPQRRLFVPGDLGQGYPLKSGARGVSEINALQGGSGQVSGAYTRSKRLKPQTSSNSQTSGSGGY